MIVLSKNKRTQSLFTGVQGASAGDTIFVGAVSTVVDSLLTVSLPEIEITIDGELRYQLLSDNELEIGDTITVDTPC